MQLTRDLFAIAKFLYFMAVPMHPNSLMIVMLTLLQVESWLSDRTVWNNSTTDHLQGSHVVMESHRI